MLLHTLVHATADDGCGVMTFPTRLAASPEDYIIDLAEDHFHAFMEEVVFKDKTAPIETIIATGYNAERPQPTFKLPIAKLMQCIEDSFEPDESGLHAISVWLLDAHTLRTCPTRRIPPENKTSLPGPSKKARVDSDVEIDLTCYE